MPNFPRVDYAAGNVKVSLDLTGLEERAQKAQQWLGDRVLEDSRASMPQLTGSLQQRSHVEDNGKKVIFPGPYARYQYGGVVMVDSETGKGPRKIPTGPGEYVLRFRKGAKLVPTDRPLKYSSPDAQPRWFEFAKQKYKQFWIDGVKQILGGK